jgi:Flp pilus assembly protein protease CpaA
MHQLPIPLQFGLAAMACLLAIHDFRTFRLPNKITLPLLLLGLVWHALAPLGQGWQWSLRGALLGPLPLLWFVLRGKMGAGDLKFMAAFGAWVGAWSALHVLAFSGPAAVICELARRAFRPADSSVAPVAESSSRSSQTVTASIQDPVLRRNWIPFSIPLTAGLVLLLLFPGWERPQVVESVTEPPPVVRSAR